MNKNNAGFLVFLGVATAVAIGAFFLAPNLFKTNPELASDTAPKTNMVDATAPAPETVVNPVEQGLPADAEKADSPAVETAEPAAAASAFVMPSFDLLRVEPDGSTVIAGKAAPGSRLDVMNGETVIATTHVGPSGDFAVILDTPLPAGDYQLTLRVTGEDGTVRQSEEVATVSVPETAGGDLLAMVSKPGKASRIIAQPAAAPADESVETAAAPAAADDGKTPDATTKLSDTASTDTAERSPTTEMSVAEKADGGADSAVGAVDGVVTEGDTEVAAVENPSGTAPSVDQIPALPDAASILTTSAPQISAENQPANSMESASSTNVEEKTGESDAETAVEVAAVSPDAGSKAASGSVPADANVRVDAVEIEGDQIFIAGSATPGYQVRIAAGGKVIGTDTADESGRFIVEATTQLAVGDHVITADLMDPAGENVLLRATVPFNRPEGEALAAVAPAEATAGAANPAGKQLAAASAPGELVLPDIASLSKMRESAFEALSDVKQMASSGEPPETAAMATALELAVDKLKSAAMAGLPAGSSAEAMAVAQSMRIQAGSALAALMPEEADGSSGTVSPSGNDTKMIDGLASGDLSKVTEIVAKAETALSEPADMTIAKVGEAGETVASQGQPGDPKTILQAPLASTPGAVIIRRGDTLWQISRRTYGEGVRYTTIYVANRSQIQNPDRIKPGQVFSVPEKPLENAEEMHQQLLGKGKIP
ncbi:MAG: LysM peptidoglycan-binding domain-containing protein [Hoeflea sp.]|uniref:LysM peptidoglycan-binding domain-containing protein n=1 Tax=Hoeflea sp. TaxID=1940281 RepID=UPI003EF7751C